MAHISYWFTVGNFNKCRNALFIPLIRSHNYELGNNFKMIAFIIQLEKAG